MFFIGIEMNYLLMLGSGGKCDCQSDGRFIFHPVLSIENNAFNSMKQGRSMSELRVEKILFGIVPLGWWFKSQMAADRFKPLGFGQSIIHESETKCPKLRLGDRKANPLRPVGQGDTAVLEGAG